MTHLSRYLLKLLIRSLAILALVGFRGVSSAEEVVQFNRDILPILSDQCFLCHGPDAESREGGFRLDHRESAIGPADSGEHPIVPGKPETSELLRRLLSDDESERMPPAELNKKRLAPEQIEVVRRWISQGANYERHWAFVAPVRKMPPKVTKTDWPQGPIDQFLLANMEKAGLEPSKPASRATLLRRVTFDLIGLPPTPEELHAFETDKSDEAYERVVDRLLDSKHFGEKMAVTWLDAARYADTNGYLQNGYRVSWPWRDWVVQAWNDNLSYDRFLTCLLAGDQLEDADEQSRLATCFLRMHMITSEGGSLDEEFRVEYAADRAETVGTVFMGLTMNCCRCHDHKYDPISQKEYYQLFAMFADPKGEDPVKDHSRDPAFLPYVRLNKTGYTMESERLQRCISQTKQLNNPNAAARLTLQSTMLASGLPVMVMETNPSPRQNFVLQRGAYDNADKSQPVEPGGIDSVLTWQNEQPRSRLGFSQWLTADDHPLTSRVEVNRLWKEFFGRGFVATPEDFGRQGSYPTHPELLDYLAVEFRENGWNRKALIRQMVLTAAYQQSSFNSTRHQEIDPTNQWLARMNRRRLSAEAIRDQALAASGLLNKELGGFATLPYQPAKLWIEGANSPGYGRGKYVLTSIYEPSSGSELYRRSLYTFWNRNAPPPQMIIFDAPGRNFCSVSRARTNTPLQALVTMNDTQFVEAARVLAERTLMDDKLPNAKAKLADIALRCTGRSLSAESESLLLDGLRYWRTQYQQQPERAERFLSNTGQSPRCEALDKGDVAAWTMVATTILNLDATLVVD